MALALAVIKRQEAKKVLYSLFEKKPKSFGIGQDVQPKRDLTHFVKWPHYIMAAVAKGYVYKCLKVPLATNQFTQALDTKELHSSSSWPTSANQRQSKRRSGDGWPSLRKKMLVKGMSPPRCHLSF